MNFKTYSSSCVNFGSLKLVGLWSGGISAWAWPSWPLVTMTTNALRTTHCVNIRIADILQKGIEHI